MSSAVGPETFRRVCSQFATGVAVATVRAADGTPHGLTVNSFTSVSLDPPLILICIGDLCDILPHFAASCWFGINFLTSAQQNLCTVFAAETDNRFAGIEWYEAPNGAPLLPETLGWMECEKTGVIHAGDHSILLGKVVAADATDGSALVYFNRSYRTV